MGQIEVTSCGGRPSNRLPSPLSREVYEDGDAGRTHRHIAHTWHSAWHITDPERVCHSTTGIDQKLFLSLGPELPRAGPNHVHRTVPGPWC